MLVGILYLIKSNMKKIIIVFNIIVALSYISLYSYISVFYIKFGKLATLDPKDLECNIVYQTILFLQLFACFLIIVMFLMWIINSIIRRNIIINKLVVLTLINALVFFVLYHFDFGNLQSWFFD